MSEYCHSVIFQVCTLETEWLFRSGDDVTGDSGVGDDVKGGEQMEEGEGRQVVVALKDGKETEFTVKLSSGRTLCCSLPHLYTNKAGRTYSLVQRPLSILAFGSPI